MKIAYNTSVGRMLDMERRELYLSGCCDHHPRLIPSYSDATSRWTVRAQCRYCVNATAAQRADFEEALLEAEKEWEDFRDLCKR